MKRILALILVLVMCVGMLASCSLIDKITGKKDDETTSKYDVASAASYLYNVQLKDIADKATPNDFDVLKQVKIDGVTYTVTWTTDNAKVVIKESAKEKFMTVDVPENNDAEFTYKLTATITDPDGKTATKEVTLKVPVLKAEEGVVKAPEAGVAYKLYLDQKTLQRRIYALSTFRSGKIEATNDPKQATDYFVEVAEGGYYIYAMVNGAKKYLSYTQAVNPKGGYYDNVAYTDTAESIWKYDSEFTVWYVTHEASTFGLGAYSSNEAFGISNISFFKDEAKKDGQYPAKFITKEYAETLEPEVGITGPEELDKDTLTIAEANEFGLKFVHNTYSDNKYYIEGKITKIEDTEYGNFIITDAAGENSLTIYGSFIGGAKFGQSTSQPKVGDTVKLYGIIGQYNNKAQMKNADILLINGEEPGKTPSVEISVEDFLEMAFALEVGAEQTGPFTFDGVVVGRSEDGYDNVIVALGGQTDKGIMCYRLTDPALTVGKEFNFTAGRVKNYNGTIEFMDVVVNSIDGVAVKLPEVPENYTGAQLVDAIYQLQNGQKLTGPYTLTGVVSDITEAYSTQFGNSTFTIIVDGLTDKPILCYRIKGDKGNGLAIGDTVTISGAFTNYGGKFETVQGEATITNVVKGQGGSTGGGSTDTTIPTPDANLADLVAEIYALADGSSITGPFVVEGVITAVDSYTNPTVVVAGLTDKPIYCFKLKSDSFAEGQTIIFTAGSAKNYQGTYEFMDCTLHAIDGVAVGGGTTGGDTTDTPVVEVPTEFKATLDMMGTTNFVSRTTDTTVYAANGITYTNNKAKSQTDNLDITESHTFSARAYQGSTVTVEYAEGFTTVVIVLDDYSSGKYLVGFDNITIEGATIARNGDTVVITFAQSVTSFTTPNLPKQARIESISVA